MQWSPEPGRVANSLFTVFLGLVYNRQTTAQVMIGGIPVCTNYSATQIMIGKLDPNNKKKLFGG